MGDTPFPIVKGRSCSRHASAFPQHQLVVYGGLSGRLDQTAHTLHALYKLRREREWAWIVSEESLTCVLDAVSARGASRESSTYKLGLRRPCMRVRQAYTDEPHASLSSASSQGSHELYLPHALLGKTCGILPVGVDSAQVTTTGLEWNLGESRPVRSIEIALPARCRRACSEADVAIPSPAHARRRRRDIVRHAALDIQSPRQRHRHCHDE